MRAKIKLLGSHVHTMSPHKKILLIDDELDAIEAMSMLLELEGYDVRCAGSGPEAFEVVTTFLPDVALIDIKMPRMNGLEVASLLRKNPALIGIRLIALSGGGQSADVQRSKHAGFNLHLTKPVSVNDVVRAIES